MGKRGEPSELLFFFGLGSVVDDHCTLWGEGYKSYTLQTFILGGMQFVEVTGKVIHTVTGFCVVWDSHCT